MHPFCFLGKKGGWIKAKNLFLNTRGRCHTKKACHEAQLDGWTFLAPNNNGKKDDEDEEVDLTRIYIYIYISTGTCNNKIILRMKERCLFIPSSASVEILSNVARR